MPGQWSDPCAVAAVIRQYGRYNLVQWLGAGHSKGQKPFKVDTDARNPHSQGSCSMFCTFILLGLRPRLYTLGLKPPLYNFIDSIEKPLFPTCQVRVVRFYQSSSRPPPCPPPPPSPRQQVTASGRAQWALPDLNSKCHFAVCTTGPQPQAQDRSGHCRTVTASSRSTTGPQLQAPDRCGQSRSRKRQSAVGSTGPQPQVPNRSGQGPTSNIEATKVTTMATRSSPWHESK